MRSRFGVLSTPTPKRLPTIIERTSSAAPVSGGQLQRLVRPNLCSMTTPPAHAASGFLHSKRINDSRCVHASTTGDSQLEATAYHHRTHEFSCPRFRGSAATLGSTKPVLLYHAAHPRSERLPSFKTHQPFAMRSRFSGLSTSSPKRLPANIEQPSSAAPDLGGQLQRLVRNETLVTLPRRPLTQ